MAHDPVQLHGRRRRTLFIWIPGLDGSEVSYQDYYFPDGRRMPSFKIRCLTHVGQDCERGHGDYDKFKTQCGDIEPLAFLHCWLKLDCPRSKHPRSNPRDRDVAAYAEQHRDELEALRVEVIAAQAVVAAPD